MNRIRLFDSLDVESIYDIYAYYVKNSTAIFDLAPMDKEVFKNKGDCMVTILPPIFIRKSKDPSQPFCVSLFTFPIGIALPTTFSLFETTLIVAPKIPVL